MTTVIVTFSSTPSLRRALCMKKSQSGFTLVELVVVIVLLGILGVAALGRFQDLSGDAAEAALKGIASELSSSAAINFAAMKVDPSSGLTIATADCTDGTGAPGDILDGLMASGSAPTSNLTYIVSAGGTIATEDGACASGETYRCTISDSRSTGSGAVTYIICTG
jgi:prepilin-type N-terminal cleavage/methylation domain-containing protein